VPEARKGVGQDVRHDAASRVHVGQKPHFLPNRRQNDALQLSQTALHLCKIELQGHCVANSTPTSMQVIACVASLVKFPTLAKIVLFVVYTNYLNANYGISKSYLFVR
jgi:hypothetical protein